MINKKKYFIGKKINIWTILIVVVVLFILYQIRFSWGGSIPSTTVPKNETVFITAIQTRYGVRNSSFASLDQSLKLWSFNPYQKRVQVKFKDMLPGKSTTAILLYEHGYSDFQNESSMTAISTYPFRYFYKKTINLVVEKVNGEGEASILFGEKKLILQPGESYSALSIQGYTLVRTVIQNQGLYQKKEFTIMP